MNHLNSFVFYILGKWTDSGYLTLREPVKANIQAYQTAQQILSLLIDGTNDTGIRLDESRHAAIDFRNVLGEILDLFQREPDANIPEELANRYRVSMAGFDAALGLDLARAPVFYVTPKGVYSTRALITRASAVFDGYRNRVPADAIRDTNEAGRCLAFELPTAAGFHIARAAEAMIKRYMDVFGCLTPKPSERSWAHYVRELQKTAANKKVVQQIDQVRTLHRNPLSHPDDTLTMAEANALWAICTSLIHGMVADAETQQASPSPEVTGMLPDDE